MANTLAEEMKQITEDMVTLAKKFNAGKSEFTYRLVDGWETFVGVRQIGAEFEED